MTIPLTRTQKRQIETRERIFRAAMELFAAKGFAGTTVAEISAAADVGKGTFFTYFPSKEAIFRLPGETIVERMEAVARDGMATGRPAPAIIRKALTLSADWHEANREITRQMSRSGVSLDLESPSKGRLGALLERLVAHGQRQGAFTRRTPARDAAVVLAGAYFTVIAFWAVSGEGALRRRLSVAVDLVLRGLAA